MIEFKYKNNLYYTTNLPKKLKRLRITEKDIEILREFEEQKPQEKPEYEEWLYCYFYNSNNKCFHIAITKDHTKPNKYNVFKNSLWNENTKTGIKNFTKEYIDKLILLNGKPKFPIILDENNLPILETIYNWKMDNLK